MSNGKRRGAGEGLVRQRADGRWEARLSLGWRDGKRVRRSYFGATQAEVLEKLDQAKHNRRNGLPVAADRQTVRDYLTAWLADIQPTMKPRTHERFDELIHLHVLPELGKVRLDKLSPAHVQNLLGHKLAEGLSASTVVAIRNVLRNALNRALRWGFIGRNVATLVDAPRIERPPVRILSVDEARKLIEAARGERLEALYTSRWLWAFAKVKSAASRGITSISMARGSASSTRSSGFAIATQPKGAKQTSKSWKPRLRSLNAPCPSPVTRSRRCEPTASGRWKRALRPAPPGMTRGSSSQTRPATSAARSNPSCSAAISAACSRRPSYPESNFTRSGTAPLR